MFFVKIQPPSEYIIQAVARTSGYALALMNSLVSIFISSLYVRRFQSVSAYLTELRLTYQEQSLYFMIILSLRR